MLGNQTQISERIRVWILWALQIPCARSPKKRYILHATWIPIIGSLHHVTPSVSSNLSCVRQDLQKKLDWKRLYWRSRAPIRFTTLEVKYLNSFHLPQVRKRRIVHEKPKNPQGRGYTNRKASHYLMANWNLPRFIPPIVGYRSFSRNTTMQ